VADESGNDGADGLEDGALCVVDALEGQPPLLRILVPSRPTHLEEHLAPTDLVERPESRDSRGQRDTAEHELDLERRQVGAGRLKEGRAVVVVEILAVELLNELEHHAVCRRERISNLEISNLSKA
jgi:hypothetical protein